ncbi:conserved hypothetical protein [Methylovorus sp. MP688]|nr:conserved hypothetical protein [Methylovorus sp. MP688]
MQIACLASAFLLMQITFRVGCTSVVSLLEAIFPALCIHFIFVGDY